MPTRQRAVRVPEHLGVVVRVQIHEPGRHDEPGRIDLTRRRAAHASELHDDPVADRDITAVARVERAIDDHAVANEHVEVGQVEPPRRNERTIRPVDREPWPTIPAMLADVADRYADLPAVIDGDTTLTFPELRAQALRVAGGLRRLGVGPGDRVAVWVPNVWEWAATAYGIWELGAVIVPIGTRYRGIEAASMLRRTEPRVLVGCPRPLGRRSARAARARDRRARKRTTVPGPAEHRARRARRRRRQWVH